MVYTQILLLLLLLLLLLFNLTANGVYAVAVVLQ
jgi:hypothetical protein